LNPTDARLEQESSESRKKRVAMSEPRDYCLDQTLLATGITCIYRGRSFFNFVARTGKHEARHSQEETPKREPNDSLIFFAVDSLRNVVSSASNVEKVSVHRHF
jgi:hypothetical protein